LVLACTFAAANAAQPGAFAIELTIRPGRAGFARASKPRSPNWRGLANLDLTDVADFRFGPAF
jgi:hypothetical protein